MEGPTAASGPSPSLPLEGILVIDCGTLIAGPQVAARLGDFGADVIKVEHPGTGDTTRHIGWEAGDTTLWWKVISRNKRPITLNLSHPKGQELLLRLVEDADVLVESFRPGTLERWGLAPGRLLERNPRLIVVRISGFGQTGPYRRRPGFGTLAEAMSGLAHLTGFADGPPVLPPVALADEVAALFGVIGALLSLYHRDRSGGRGQIVDVSLFESLFSLMGPLPAVYDRLGLIPSRCGNRIPYAAPRNVYRTKDGRWVAVSGTSQTIAFRILAAIGRPDLQQDPRFSSNQARVANVEELDRVIQAWMSDHTLDEVMAIFDEHEAAAFPVYDLEQIFNDPHYRDRGTIAPVRDDELGIVRMADVHPRLSATPGVIRWAGLPKGAASKEVYTALGLTDEDLAALKGEGVM